MHVYLIATASIKCQSNHTLAYHYIIINIYTTINIQGSFVFRKPDVSFKRAL